MIVERGEYTTFDVPDSWSILSLLCLFMSRVDGQEVVRTVSRRVGVKYPHMKKCVLRAVPKAFCTDVDTSAIINVCRPGCHVLSTKRRAEAQWRHDTLPLEEKL